MATYPELPAPHRALIVEASHATTMAYIEGHQAAAERAQRVYEVACFVLGVDPDETLKHI